MPPGEQLVRPLLRRVRLNLPLRLPSLALLEASARAGYATQECRQVLLCKRRRVCLLLRGVDPAGFHRNVDRGSKSASARRVKRDAATSSWDQECARAFDALAGKRRLLLSSWSRPHQ